MATEVTPIYHITLKGQLDPDWSEWLGELSIRVEPMPDGKTRTLLCGPIPDQAALRGLLTRLWDLNLELVELKRFDSEPGQS